MKVLLVNPEIRIKYGTYGYQAGLAALSASLKANGFTDVRLLHLNRPTNPARFRQAVRAIGPDLIGFYTTYNQYRFIRRFVSGLSKVGYSILGGPHPTIYPKVLEETPGLDGICVGEGDETIVELAKAIRERRGHDDIAGLGFKNGAEAVFNPPRPFIEDLDRLPFEDRTVFETGRSRRAGLLEISHANSFRLGRGCPFQCTFCSNHAQSKAQPGKYVRFRSLDHIFAEIGEVTRRYQPSVLYFQDDTFMSDPGFVGRFCKRYQEEVRLPFEFFGRIELVDKDILTRIRDAGGRRVSYGIESGDEGIRREVLKKRFANASVIEAFALTKKLGIVAEAFVMVGFPEETPESFGRTADLLRKIQPDLYTLSTYFPNPGTELYDRSRREGLLRHDEVPMDVVNQRDVMLDLPGFRPRAVRAARRWFAFRVYGRTSFGKAILFLLYESWIGDRLLRWATPVRRRLRRIALS